MERFATLEVLHRHASMIVALCIVAGPAGCACST
jgi:hypothetical protein